MNEELLKHIAHELHGLSANFNTFKEEQSKRDKVADEKFKTVNTKLNGFSEQFKMVNHKLRTITEQVVSNSEQLTSHAEILKNHTNILNAHTELLTKMSKTHSSIIDGQQKQDKILEMLAMRSLEQESDIKDLKRIK
ncbi:hypothetical protein EWH99_04825 [Sporolactobacillus sp. THM7-7]|nr:hypothetical protein EWH99_04825 [Sporolactobacillus sp. THM7-7]